MQTIAVERNHSSVLAPMEGASAPAQLSEREMEAVAGGLIIAPFIIAYSYAGAKGLGYAIGFSAGALAAAVALTD